MKGKKREREGERKKIEKKKREGYHGYYLIIHLRHLQEFAKFYLANLVFLQLLKKYVK
jgi:hypothetical protein